MIDFTVRAADSHHGPLESAVHVDLPELPSERIPQGLVLFEFASDGARIISGVDRVANHLCLRLRPPGRSAQDAALLGIDEFNVDVFDQPSQLIHQGGRVPQQIALIELRLNFEDRTQLVIEIVHHFDASQFGGAGHFRDLVQLIRDRLPVAVE